MGLKATLDLAHGILEQNAIPHALIGGMALSVWGAPRSTADIDFLVDGNFKSAAKQALLGVGFVSHHETDEVLQFKGVGFVDLLFANRPLSRQMIAGAPFVAAIGFKCVLPEDLIGLKIQAYKNNPKRALQDKADIQKLMEAHPALSMDRVLAYARLFSEEAEMERIKLLSGTGS